MTISFISWFLKYVQICIIEEEKTICHEHLNKEGAMSKSSRFVTVSLCLLTAMFLLAGCGGSGGDRPSSATKVGSATCTDVCHAFTADITGTQIAAAWANTAHTIDGGVQCEDCHGPASLHQGVGPIPFPNPQAAQCEVCHIDKKGFDSTIHANLNPYNGTNLSSFTGPDKFFFEGDALNSGTAAIMGVPEFFPDGKTPVTHAQHIEECSRCHNPNQRFEYANGDTSGELVKPDPNNMPDPPNITCAGCHDAHQTQQMVTIPQRTSPVGYPIFRRYFINPATGAQVNSNDPNGQNLAGFIFQPNGVVIGGTVSGKNNELKVERTCGSCHTVGKYQYSQLPTHQNDVYTQWTNSGHGTRNDPAFAEFSANPSAYTNPDTGQTYAVGTHSPSYPIDMALSKFGTTANTTQNAGNNVYACFHCHNGIGSNVWQADQQGTPQADVVFGDESVTCITCHSPHSNPTGTTHQVKVPVKMTQYSGAITINGNVFLDNTPLPSLDKTGNGTICIFCHQGRESGLTLYAAKLAAGKTITGNFFNPHYLGTAAMLWGVNAYEYAGKSYTANFAHQGANCPTCHMANPTDDNLNGGHTWWPNVATCNVAACHGGFGAIAADVTSDNGPASPDVANYRASFDTNNYTGDPGGASLSIADSIRVLQQKVIAVLQSKGIFYNDLSYPYFFSDAASTTTFTAWTPATYKAAFNISYTVKGSPSGAESQANVPNASAAVHDYKYIIQLLLDGYEDLTGAPLAGAFRPAGTRPATAYGPGQ